jgi:hypothetical protein
MFCKGGQIRSLKGTSGTNVHLFIFCLFHILKVGKDMGAVICMNLDADEHIPRKVVDFQESWNASSREARELDYGDFFCLAAEKRDAPMFQSAKRIDSFRKEYEEKLYKEGCMMSKVIRSTGAVQSEQSVKLVNRDEVSRPREFLLGYSSDLSKCRQSAGSSKLKSLKPLPIRFEISLSTTKSRKLQFEIFDLPTATTCSHSQ